MQFTPATALVGGLTLGVAAVGKFAITGRILGISGALKGFVHKPTPWRVLFTLGMVSGALVAKGITPEAFDAIPATYTVWGDGGVGLCRACVYAVCRLVCSVVVCKRGAPWHLHNTMPAGRLSALGVVERCARCNVRVTVDPGAKTDTQRHVH